MNDDEEMGMWEDVDKVKKKTVEQFKDVELNVCMHYETTGRHCRSRKLLGQILPLFFPTAPTVYSNECKL